MRDLRELVQKENVFNHGKLLKLQKLDYEYVDYIAASVAKKS